MSSHSPIRQPHKDALGFRGFQGLSVGRVSRESTPRATFCLPVATAPIAATLLMVIGNALLIITNARAASPRVTSLSSPSIRAGSERRGQGVLQPISAHAAEFVGPFFAGVNSLPPAFQVALRYSLVVGQPAELRLTQVLLRAGSDSQARELASDGIEFGCNTCGKTPYTGFYNDRLESRDIVAITLQPAAIVSRETHLALIVCGCEGLSRFRLYSVSPSTQTIPLIASGCFASGFQGIQTETVLTAQSIRPLPIVPCSGRAPRDDSVAIAAPIEESASATTTFTVSGYAAGPTWLSLTTDGTSFSDGSYGCDTTPGSTLPSWAPEGGPASAPPAVVRVHGRFNVSFERSAPSVPSTGAFCAYLQVGSRWRGIPDGPVAASTGSTWRVGDSIAVSGPATFVSGQDFTYTVSGSVAPPPSGGRSQTTGYFFLSYEPCAPTAQAEYELDNLFEYFSTSGPFTYKVTSPALTRSVDICAYLQNGVLAKSSDPPTGDLLASASQSVAMVPTSTGSALTTARSARRPLMATVRQRG